MNSNHPEQPACDRERFMKSFFRIINPGKLFLFNIIVGYLFIEPTPVSAQPSGGPYGPIRQTYEIPKGAGKIYYVAPDGKAEKSGKTLAEPTTFEAAIERVKTGDVIIMRGGTYRMGDLVLNQGITIQPYADEQPIVKGTLVATDWQNLRNGLWVTSWSHLFPSKPADWWNRLRLGKMTPLHRFNNDLVFVDGKFLQSAGWEGEVDENSYYIDYDAQRVYIGIDPTDKLVEITAFNKGLTRTIKDCHGKTSDRKGPIIRGINFTQYAYCAIEIEGTEPEGLDNEANFGKDVIGTTIENCTLSYSGRVAAYLRGDRLTLRHCRVSDSSTEGIYLLSSCDVLLEKNIFTRNNIERIVGYYPAAVKIFNQTHRVTCQDNLVIDLPYSNGIWYDVGNVDGRFLNNWVEGVGNNMSELNINRLWPSDNGFFIEISKGAICAGNVFVNCDHGVWALNSSNVHFYQNTFINSTACVGRTARSAENDGFGWHASTGPDVDKREGHIFVNNLLFGDESFKRPLLLVWQSSELCQRLSQSQLTQLDYNVYVRAGDAGDVPLIIWSPANNDNCQLFFNSPDEFQKAYPKFSAHSRYFPNHSGPLFKSTDLGNYQLLATFPAVNEAAALPLEVSKLLGQMKKYIGAYPPQ
jgi:hypothetical protein